MGTNPDQRDDGVSRLAAALAAAVVVGPDDKLVVGLAGSTEAHLLEQFSDALDARMPGRVLVIAGDGLTLATIPADMDQGPPAGSS